MGFSAIFLDLKQSFTLKNNKLCKFGNRISRCCSFCLCVYLILKHSLISAQTREIEIQKLSQEDGLANRTVYAICQDSRGFMWFGTENGLSRYDGYTFKNYFHDPDDSTSLSNNFVWSILEDHTETLWIGTVEGLNRYDRVRDCFVHFKHVPGNPASLSHSYVRPLLEDQTGTLWVGTINGLNRFDRDTETFTAYNLNPANPTAMDTSYMLALYEDRQHVLWIGTADGYFRYDRAQDRLIRPRSKINAGTITGMRGVTSFYDDGRGNLWLTMWGSNGVSRINHDQKTEKYYQHELMTSAYCLFKDANQTVWFGAAIGLYSIDFEQDRFVKFKYGEGADFPRIYVIYQDRNGVLWLGTTGRGVYKVKQPDKKFNELAFGSHGGLAGSEYDITALQQDSEGEIWFGQNKTAYLMETEAERILPFKAYPN